MKDFSYYAQEELLTFGEKLLLTGGVNIERTSNNGDAEKFYKYPKFAASFRVPTLPNFINDLKLRAAYGKAGNQPNYGQKFTSLVVITEDGLSGTRPSLALGNDAIRPELSTEFETGFDATMLNGRASLEFTVYKKTVKDLILTALRAPSTGFTSQVINGGTLVNRGTEVGVNLTPIQRGSLSWISRTTFAANHGVITELPVPAFNTGGFGLKFGATRIQQGISPTSVIGRNGRDTTFRNSAGALVKRGQPGCGLTDPAATCGTFVSRADHLSILGDALPKFNMGFSNEFNFGAFRVTSLLDWRYGGLISNLTNDYLVECCSDSQGTMGDVKLAEKINGLLALRSAKAFLEDAGFVKLRELAVSYQLPSTMVSHLFSSANAVRLEFSGRNLKTWTGYTGLDPEVSNFGNQNVARYFDVTPYPPSRSFFFSISADF